MTTIFNELMNQEYKIHRLASQLIRALEKVTLIVMSSIHSSSTLESSCWALHECRISIKANGL